MGHIEDLEDEPDEGGNVARSRWRSVAAAGCPNDVTSFRSCEMVPPLKRRRRPAAVVSERLELSAGPSDRDENRAAYQQRGDGHSGDGVDDEPISPVIRLEPSQRKAEENDQDCRKELDLEHRSQPDAAAMAESRR